MKQHSDPAGKKLGTRIVDLADLPVKPRDNGRWADEWRQFQALRVGEKALAVRLENASDCNRLGTAIHGYAESRGCRKEGWKVRTMVKVIAPGIVEIYLWKGPINPK